MKSYNNTISRVITKNDFSPNKKNTKGNADSLSAFNCTNGQKCGAGARRRRNEKHKFVIIDTP